MVLEALSGLNTKEWSFDVVGDGPEKDGMVEYCQQFLNQSSVMFHGVVAPNEVLKFFKNADAFIFASSFEGRPNVVIEAMASSVPVIASKIPAISELIEDGKNGFMFSLGDKDRLRELLEHVITHPMERKIMGVKAKESIISKELTWKKNGQEYAKIYERVIK